MNESMESKFFVIRLTFECRALLRLIPNCVRNLSKHETKCNYHYHNGVYSKAHIHTHPRKQLRRVTMEQ